ncbi:hypothetical protein lerEdw1_019435 [Lerista edwardsae]|nr:hypothetical protein lerEdw1_019435 [Lerista edwardsae]
MLIRRLLSRPWRWLQHPPPIASSAFMLLLCVFWLSGIREKLALVPSLLTRPSQAYRLVTYCLCHADAAQLLLSLLFFPLLGWHQEVEQGTLRYLHASVLGAAVSALLYLLLAGLWAAPPGTAVSGYTPVHLAMLGCHQSKQRHGSGWMPASLLAGLLLGLNQLLSSQSPFLLHLSGLLTCLACWASDWAGILSPLELSESCLERLHEGTLCRTLARRSFLRFVVPPATRILPTADPAAGSSRIPSAPAFQTQSFPTPPSAPPLAAYWSNEPPGLGQGSRLLHAPDAPPHFPGPGGASDVRFWALRESLLEEELLQAGIRASLQDVTEEGVTLSKSSVSSLR